MTERQYSRQTFSRRLRTQLLAIYIAIITLFVGGVSILSYKQSETVVRDQSGEIMQQYFQQSEYGIKQQTQEVEKLLRLLMIQEDLQEYMREGWDKSYDTVRRTMEIFSYTNTVLGNYEYIDSVYYYGNDGTALGVENDSNHLTQGTDLNLPWYQLDISQETGNHTGAVFWYGGYSSKDFAIEPFERDIPYVTAVSAVWLEPGRYAVIVVNIRQEQFAHLFAQSQNIEERENYLINDNGEIIIHQDEKKVGSQVDFDLQNLKQDNEEYFMNGDIQINYHRIEDLSWTFITEIPQKVLYKELTALKRSFFILAAGGIAAAAALSAYSLYRLTLPLNDLRRAMERMENGALGEKLDESSKNELGLLGRQFNKMSGSIQTMVGQIRQMEEEKRILEKEALQGQLNPHFLFNTLSNMRFMAQMGQMEPLETCFGALGKILLPMYRSTGEMWSLRQELDYLSNYFTILNCRFGGKLSLEIEIEDVYMDMQVLKFILQPLAENAAEHGFRNGEEEGIIILGAEQKEDRLTLYMEDNGKGIPPKEQERLEQTLKQAENQKELYRNHVGIVNVHRRLKVHFGEEYGLRLESVFGEFTCVYLTMPVIKEKS